MRSLISKRKYIEIGYVVFILSMALYLRLWWIHYAENIPVFDFKTYKDIATHIFYHQGHSLNGEAVAFQGMGYPTLLGYWFRFRGSNLDIVAKELNVILSMGTLLFTYPILLKLTKKKWVVYTSFTIIALLPNYIAYTNVISTEVFSTFLFSVILWMQLLNVKEYIKYPCLGIMIGIAALTKPFFMAYPVVAAVTYWLKHKNIKQTLCLLGVTVMVMIMVIAPWTYRNMVKFNQFIPVSYNSGYVLYINNNDYNATGAWMSILSTHPSESFMKEMNRILKKGQRSIKVAPEMEPILKEEAKKWIKDHPIEFVKLGMIRLKQTFFHGTWDVNEWCMNDRTKEEAKLKDFNEKQKMEYLRHKNFVTNLRDLLLYILSSFGFIYILINTKAILVGLFTKRKRLSYERILPSINSAFFISVYFVYEGQARYNFPVLMLFVMSMVLSMDYIQRGLKDLEKKENQNV